MSPKKAFGILAGIFGVAIVLGVIGGLTTDPSPPAASAPVDRATLHRLTAAEQMIDRLSKKLDRTISACNQNADLAPKAAEYCKASTLRAQQTLPTIRRIAVSGDAADWSAAIDAAHKLEADLERPLSVMERR